METHDTQIKYCPQGLSHFNRMESWLLFWLVLSLVSLNVTCKRHDQNKGVCKNSCESQDQDKNPGSDLAEDQHGSEAQSGESGENYGSSEDHSRGSGRVKAGRDGHKGPCKNPNRSFHTRSEENTPLSHGQNSGHQIHCVRKKAAGVSNARLCMKDVDNVLKKGNREETFEAMKSLKQVLEDTEVNETTSMSANTLVALLYKPKGPFAGLEIYANENEATSEKTLTNSKVSVCLPSEIGAGSNNTIVFCMLTWSGTNKTSDILYENRLVGLSVRGKNISGLQQRANITINLTMEINENQKPSCRFLDFSTNNFSDDGCTTLWRSGQSQVICSCDHFTYFAVLLVSSDLPVEHQEILSYITLIGCSLSLFVLVITVLLFIINRKVRADISMKVHINLAISLILLNVHFLPSHTVAALAPSGLCLYFALALHFSLLATFSWMALEGFHLYLLLVRVFNIYIRRYLLKLSLVGWGVPVAIVSLVVVIDRDVYGVVPLNSKNPNSTEICYIVNDTVKMVTTVGMFSLAFCFNLIMLGVTIRRVVSLRKKTQSGYIGRDRVKQDICTLLGVTVLLGIPWGLVFFSFGYLTIPGHYAFCILNSLQGFFIFLRFLMSLRKIRNSTAMMSITTQSTKS